MLSRKLSLIIAAVFVVVVALVAYQVGTHNVSAGNGRTTSVSNEESASGPSADLQEAWRVFAAKPFHSVPDLDELESHVRTSWANAVWLGDQFIGQPNHSWYAEHYMFPLADTTDKLLVVAKISVWSMDDPRPSRDYLNALYKKLVKSAQNSGDYEKINQLVSLFDRSRKLQFASVVAGNKPELMSQLPSLRLQ